MCNNDLILNVYRKSMKPNKKNNSSEPPDQEIIFMRNKQSIMIEIYEKFHQKIKGSLYFN